MTGKEIGSAQIFFSNFHSFKSENDTKSRIKMKKIGKSVPKMIMSSRLEAHSRHVRLALKIFVRRRGDLGYVIVLATCLSIGCLGSIGRGKFFKVKFLKYFFYSALQPFLSDSIQKLIEIPGEGWKLVLGDYVGIKSVTSIKIHKIHSLHLHYAIFGLNLF